MQIEMGSAEASARATALIQDLRRACIGHTDSLPLGSALYIAVSATFKLVVVLVIEVLEHELGRMPNSAEVAARLSSAPIFDKPHIESVLREHVFLKEHIKGARR